MVMSKERDGLYLFQLDINPAMTYNVFYMSTSPQYGFWAWQRRAWFFGLAVDGIVFGLGHGRYCFCAWQRMAFFFGSVRHGYGLGSRQHGFGLGSGRHGFLVRQHGFLACLRPSSFLLLVADGMVFGLGRG